MKLPRILAAAALAMGTMGLAAPALAQDMHRDATQHAEVRRTVTRTVVHTDRDRDDVRRHNGWNRRHHGWDRRKVRTCRNVWRNHNRVRVCRTVWRSARY